MASLGFGRLHERVRCQNHRNHQCYQQTPQLHTTTSRKPAATINCCDSIAVPSSYTIRANQGNALGLEFVANAVCLGKMRVYEQLAALESWLQFQHRSDRQTTQRFQGALQNLRPAQRRQACHCRSSIGEGCPFSCMN